MTMRIFVDFNSMMTDERRRVYIGTIGSPHEDQEILGTLRAGLRVMLDSGDLEVEGTLELDTDERMWYAVPDWSTQHDLVSPGPDILYISKEIRDHLSQIKELRNRQLRSDQN